MKREYVHQTFHQIALEFPDEVAIDRSGSRICYGELEARSESLANFLIEAGCSKGSIVAILAEDTVEVVTGIIAVLRAGGVFVPLDPVMPVRRLATLLSAVPPRLLLVESRFLDRLKDTASAIPEETRIIRLGQTQAAENDSTNGDRVLDRGGYWNSSLPHIESEPDDMCYVYFTSGSTGKPKGIAGRLKAISHFVDWEKNLLGITRHSRVSQLTSPSFDAYLRDVFVPLCAGGTVCAPADREDLLDTRKLVKWIDDSRVNVIHCVPSLFRSLFSEELDPAGFSELRFVMLAGEPLLPSDVRRWTDIFGDRIQLVNLYGPSETTMTKFFYFVKPADKDRRSIPIGKPMEGARAIIVDASGKVSSPGAVGEILIRTPFRSLGYYNQTELTSEVFVQNPFANDPQDIVYKTGDLGRVLDDGNFEFLGRRDHQVKIRGMRIEIAEVEDLLRSHKSIKDVVVVDREDTSRNKYLCAYAVLNEPIESSEIREYLSLHLLDPAVPSSFVFMDALPRTINGKVDRRALPATQSRSARKYVAPRTPIEEEMVEIWMKLLAAPRVGVHDNFFELGGHSLLATQLLSRMRSEFGVDVPLRSLFADPTLEGIARAVTGLLLEKQGDHDLQHILSEISRPTSV